MICQLREAKKTLQAAAHQASSTSDPVQMSFRDPMSRVITRDMLDTLPRFCIPLMELQRLVVWRSSISEDGGPGVWKSIERIWRRCCEYSADASYIRGIRRRIYGREFLLKDFEGKSRNAHVNEAVTHTVHRN